MQYFVVMQDYGEDGLEAIVNPALTCEQIVTQIKTRELDNIVHIDHVQDTIVRDVTDELIDAAEAELNSEVLREQQDEHDAQLLRLPEAMLRPIR